MNRNMTQNELIQAIETSTYSVLTTTALWQSLLQYPGDAVAAEVVGQALDALMEVSHALMDRLEAMT